MSAAILCGVLLAGCSAAQRSAPQPVMLQSVQSDRDVAFASQEEMVRLVEQVEDLAASEDCSGVCDTVERICSLSGRICTITERHPEDRELAARCRDGQNRCEQARERGQDACRCGQGP